MVPLPDSESASDALRQGNCAVLLLAKKNITVRHGNSEPNFQLIFQILTFFTGFAGAV